MKTVIIQKALIFDRSGRLLLLRRSNTDVRRPLQWDLVGGMVEKGESLEEGMQREIAEETGLQVTDCHLIYSLTEVADWHDDKGRHTENVVRLFYVTRSKNETIRVSYEHDEARWVEPVEALTLLTYERHESVLRYFLDKQLEY